MKISIIIPCFNMKQYLPKCLMSILEQTLANDIEIICVDDGSTDGTDILLKEYAQKYSNIVVLKEKNMGSGKARNKGIARASGKYIAFLDADDFYPDENALAILYYKAEEHNAKICGGSACKYRNGVYTYAGLRNGMVNEKEGWVYKNEQKTYVGFWRFIYLRSMLIGHGILFPDYFRGQDAPFFLKAVAKASKIYYVTEFTYCYRQEHKKEKYNVRKSIDSVKAVRDYFDIAYKENMTAILWSLVEDLHGELSALIYRQIALGVNEMNNLAVDINRILILSGIGDELHLLEGLEAKSYVKNIYDTKKQFLDELKGYKKILVYGAGRVGRDVMAWLRSCGIFPGAFVVSDASQNGKVADGIKIQCIDEYLSVKKESLIIIATYSYLHAEIIKNLKEKQFANIYIMDLEKFFLLRE